MAEDRYTWLFETDSIKNLVSPKALKDMSALKELDPPRFEELLEAVQKLRPMGGMKRFLGHLDKYERDLKKAEKKKIARGENVDEDGFSRNAEGTSILNKPENVRNAIRLMGLELMYDDFSGRTFYIDEYRRKRPVDDDFITDFWVRCADRFDFDPNVGTLWKFTIHETARQNRFHPVKDMLNSLKWDGKHRLGSWLIDYLGADDTPFNRKVGELVLKAGIARIYQPGIKFDQALLLQGDQGLGKSTVATIMAMDEDWFTDSMPLMEGDQKIIEATRGKWICEIGEMRGRDRVSVDTIKAQLSRTVDRARMAYGHTVNEYPRQFIYIITANPKQIFSDTTGNRRYWPVTLTQSVDLDALARDMGQLWAEALDAVGYGFEKIDARSLMLPKDLWEAANELTSAMMVTNPYAEKFESILGDARGIISSSELWDILGVPVSQRNRYDIFGKALEDLGFSKTRRKYGGVSNISCYVRWDDSDRPPIELVADRSSVDGRIRGVCPRVAIDNVTHDFDDSPAEDL